MLHLSLQSVWSIDTHPTMDQLHAFTENVSEEFHFVGFSKNSSMYNANSIESSPDLNKTMRPDEFSMSIAEESDFEKAFAEANKGLVPVSSCTSPRKKSLEMPDVPDYGRRLAEEIQQLRICEEKVRKGEMPLTSKLRNKFAAACINISPNTSSSSSGSYMLEMSQATKDLLDAEDDDPSHNKSLTA